MSRQYDWNIAESGYVREVTVCTKGNDMALFPKSSVLVCDSFAQCRVKKRQPQRSIRMPNLVQLRQPPHLCLPIRMHKAAMLCSLGKGARAICVSNIGDESVRASTKSYTFTEDDESRVRSLLSWKKRWIL